MKKNIAILISVLLFLCCMFGCSSEETTEDLDALLDAKTESSMNENDKKQDEQQDVADPDVFVSVWPDELPLNPDHFPSPGRPIEHQILFVDENGVERWTSVWDYESMYLYDFPDPEQFFHKFGHDMIYKNKVIDFYYNKQTIRDDGTTEILNADVNDLNLLIESLVEAGYTENSERTETSYYCEKYGVSILIILSNDYPWPDDDPRLPFHTAKVCCYVRLQLIDPDYEMDLETIKAEEYQKWLSEHE